MGLQGAQAVKRTGEGDILGRIDACDFHHVLQVQAINEFLTLAGRSSAGRHAAAASGGCLGGAAGEDDLGCVFQGEGSGGPGCSNFAHAVAKDGSRSYARFCQHPGDTYLNGKEQGLTVGRFLQNLGIRREKQLGQGASEPWEEQVIEFVNGAGKDGRGGIEHLAHAAPLGPIAGIDKDRTVCESRAVACLVGAILADKQNTGLCVRVL